MKLIIPFLLLCGSVCAQKTTSIVVNNSNILDATGILNWSSPSIWSNGIPANGDTVNVYLPTNFTSDKTFGALNIDIPTSANYTIYLFGIPLFTIPISISDNMIITGNRTVTVTDQLHLTDGNIQVNGTLKILGDPNNYGRIASVDQGNITGTFIYQKWVDRCNKWSLYGGPFDASLTQYSDSTDTHMIYTGIPDGQWPNFPWINTYLFDEDWASAGYDGYVVPSSCNDIIPRGRGFWYWNSDTTYNSASNNPIPQEWKVSTSGSIDFSTPFSFPVQYTNNSVSASDGWNLLANPYPGTIDWDAGGWTKSGIDGALYEYNTCTQTYSTYVSGVGVNGGDRFISPLQGFYVKANTSGPQLSSASTVIISNTHQLKSLAQNIIKIQFDEDETVVRLNNNGTLDFDPAFDGYKYFTGEDKIYTETMNADISYSINTVKDTFNIIPLYTKGEGALHFSEIINWTSDYDIYLEDMTIGDTIAVTPSLVHPFSSLDTLNFKHHFNLIFKKSAEPIDASGIPETSQKEYELQANYISSEKIRLISNYTQKPVLLEVYNTMGQKTFAKIITFNADGYILEKPHTFSIIRVYNEDMDQTIKVF